MDFWRKILILAIIVLFSYILYRLLLKRSVILQGNIEKVEGLHVEGFTPATTGPSISNFNVNALTNNNGITDPLTAKQFKQFVIKASYHTCYTGTDLSAEMVTYALKRGYRWLDFYTDCIGSSSATTVSYSNNDTEVASTPTKPTFSEIFTTIARHAFISPDSPNPNDPIFIQIRTIYDGKDENQPALTLMKSLTDSDSILYSRLYQGQIDKTITMDKLLGKVIFAIDNTIYKKLTNKNGFMSYNDNGIITTADNSKVASLNAPLPLILKDNFTTNPPKIAYQILPTGSTANSDIYSTIQKIGCQITPQAIWSNDGHLANYEAIFDNANAAIVPLSNALKYTKANDPNVVSSSYPGAFSGK